MSSNPNIIIIGGGITGLAAAYRLEQLAPNAQITLLEASNRIGGKLWSEDVHGFTVELGADSFLSRKPRGIGLCEELGLSTELIGRRPENKRTFVKRNGTLHDLPEGLTGLVPTNIDALAKSSLISAAGRERLAQETEIPARLGDDDESLTSFMTRRMGHEVYSQLIEPLMSGIYGGNGDKLSLLATFPQLRQIEKKHGSLLKGLGQTSPKPSPYPPFISMRQGMGSLPKLVSARLKTTQVKLNSPAQSITRTGTGYRVTLTNGQSETADKILLTTPAFVTAQLTATLDQELAHTHSQIEHGSSVTLTLGYKQSEIDHPLNGYGYVIPGVEKADVLACTWTSSKWANRAPQEHVAIRVFLGKVGRRPIIDTPLEEITALAQAELQDTLGITAEPIMTKLSRWRNGMPQYMLGHLDRVTTIEKRVAQLENFAVAGAPYRGVGIPDCIRSGEQAAQQLIQTKIS